MDWNFKREESTNGVIPEGKYRIRVNKVEKKIASTGRQMLSFQFDVSGQPQYLFHNIVFLEDRPEITNRNLTQFFDSFKDIPTGDFTLANWVGKVGACTVKNEEYNGEMKARVGYFIKADKQSDIPSWQEPKRQNNGTSASASSSNTDFTSAEGMEIPF